MKATMIKVQSRRSKYGDIFYYAFFKFDDGRSARSCLYPKCRNFARWLPHVEAVQQGREVILDGIRRKGSIVDADSLVFPIDSVNH